MRIFKILILGLMIFPALGFGEPSPETDSTVMAKEQWVEFYAEQLPNQICAADGYLRSCYELSQLQCLKQATSFMEACMDKAMMQMPDQLDLALSTQWAKVNTFCVIDVFDHFTDKQKNNSPECRSASSSAHNLSTPSQKPSTPKPSDDSFEKPKPAPDGFVDPTQPWSDS